ncbi:MAG: aromatic amino acid lyase [Ilumatobacteraceae bacterium]
MSAAPRPCCWPPRTSSPQRASRGSALGWTHTASSRLHSTPNPHVAIIAADLRRHLVDTKVSRQARQAPVSYRVTPQVHGVAAEAIERLRAAALADICANGDNPAMFDELVNSGNFHGAALCARVEAATLAIVHLGNLAEKRLTVCSTSGQAALAGSWPISLGSTPG